MCGSPTSASAPRRCARRKAEAALAKGDVDGAVAALDLDPPDDVQATGAVKKHLAGVLLRRVAKQLMRGAAMSERALDISLTVNGERVSERVEARKTLVDFLRDDLALTGSHVGCEHGVCGACTVRVNGEIVRGCLMLAVQCDGATVETIEGLSDSGEIADLQAAFEQRNALQCGYCTPGMIAAAQESVAARRRPVARRTSANISPATTAAAPATTPSSMRWNQLRKRARERSDENHRQLPARAQRPRPAELVYRPLGAAAESATAYARARAICQRRHAAAHGACRLSCARRMRTRAS